MNFKTSSCLLNLQCSSCGKILKHDQLMRLCPECQKPLFAKYDLKEASKTLTKETLKTRVESLWRYEEVLPVQKKESIITMKEGWTPLIFADRLGEVIGCKNTYIKDESRNPTGSFKARGLCLAVSKACELGAKGLVIPSAGNAAGALSAYAAKRGIPAHVFLPSDIPMSFRAECEALGARVTLVNGLITDCGVKAREVANQLDWFDVGTLREPYRVEGKKTMAYEVVEQLDWNVPEVIIYPTGGGTGLIGMWKAFQEMEDLGLIGSKRPRMVAVQSNGCAPIVKAYNEGKDNSILWKDAHTVAGGLRVPSAIGDFLVLKALRESQGTAVMVSDSEMIEACNKMGRYVGIFAAPESGACLVAHIKLLEQGWISPDETVVLFNTGTGTKYSHCWAKN